MAGWRRWRGATNAISKRGKRWEPPWPFVEPPPPALPARWLSQAGHPIRVPPPRGQRWSPPWPFIEPPLPELPARWRKQAGHRIQISPPSGMRWEPPWLPVEPPAPEWIPTQVGTRIRVLLPQRHGQRWEAPPFVEPPPAPSIWIPGWVGARSNWPIPKNIPRPIGHQWAPPNSPNAFLFIPPTIGEEPLPLRHYHESKLASLITTPKGISVLETSTGVYEQLRYPDQDELAAALSYYLGGHEYVITPAEAAKLIAAGYGANLTPL